MWPQMDEEDRYSSVLGPRQGAPADGKLPMGASAAPILIAANGIRGAWSAAGASLAAISGR